MIINQFLYTRKEEKKVDTGISDSNGNPTFRMEIKEYTDSFNLSKVIRSISLEDGRRLVLLDDLHRRKEIVPIVNKQGKMTGTKNEENTFQSEIYLQPSDSERFVKLMSV